MRVNTSEQAFFDELAKTPPEKPTHELTLEEFREMADLFSQHAGPASDATYQDFEVPVRDGSSIKVRIFNHDIGNSPILIFFPGCGYVLDLFESNTIACSRIAKYSGIKVALVNYRLAPEHHLPIPINDGLDATKYLIEHADEFELDANNLFVGGMSSGAHTATVISNYSKHDESLKIKRQILVGGIYDLTFSYHEFDEYAEKDLLCTQEAIEYLLTLWGIPDEKLDDPMLSPAFEKDFTGLPPTTLIVGEYDRLRNQTELYHQKLETANMDCEKLVLPGQTHNTYILRGVMTDGEDPAEIIADVIKKTLSLTT